MTIVKLNETRKTDTRRYQSLKRLNLSGVEQHDKSDCIILSKDKKTLIHCPKNFRGAFEIPQGIEIIGIEAFAGCNKLNSIIIPKSVQKIEILAFANCTGLSKISLATLEPFMVGEEAFKNIHFEHCVLEVPAGATHNYNNASTWSEFNCILEKVQNT